MVRAADHAVNARDLPGRFTATARPGGLPEAVTRLWESPGRDGPHEDTAHCSAYEDIAGWSISAGYDSASMLVGQAPRSVGGFGPAADGADGDGERDAEGGGGAHLGGDQGGESLQFAWGDLEDELVVDLQEHPRAEAGRRQLGADSEHGHLDHVGGG